LISLRVIDLIGLSLVHAQISRDRKGAVQLCGDRCGQSGMARMRLSRSLLLRLLSTVIDQHRISFEFEGAAS